MSDGLFLVGTARGVGTTLIGVGIVSLLRRMGVDATLMTPISTGGSMESASKMLERIGVDDPRRLTMPVVFETMAAPYVARQIEERAIDLEAIHGAFRELRKRRRFVVVEGGGILVPINRRYAMIDLLGEMALPSLIVGRTSRGTLNHCLLTQRMMMVRGEHPLGFLLNGFGQFGDGFAESMNPDVLAELADPTPVLGTVEWRPGYPGDPQTLAAALARLPLLVRSLRALIPEAQAIS